MARTTFTEFITDDWVLALTQGHLFAVKVIGYETPERMLVQRFSHESGEIAIFFVNPYNCALLHFYGMNTNHLVYDPGERKGDDASSDL